MPRPKDKRVKKSRGKRQSTTTPTLQERIATIQSLELSQLVEIVEAAIAHPEYYEQVITQGLQRILK